MPVPMLLHTPACPHASLCPGWEVTPEEIQDLLEGLGIKVETSELRRMIRAADTDGNGRIQPDTNPNTDPDTNLDPNPHLTRILMRMLTQIPT